jgi:putative restriction endonuclease
MGRMPSSVAMKLTHLSSLDTASGRKGLPGASQLDRAVWDELQSHWDSVALQAASFGSTAEMTRVQMGFSCNA